MKSHVHWNIFCDMKSTRRPVVMSRCSSRSLASLLFQRLHALLHLTQGPQGAEALPKAHEFKYHMSIYLYYI